MLFCLSLFQSTQKEKKIMVSFAFPEYYLKGVLRRQEEGAKVLNDSIRENSDGQQRQQFV